MIETITLTTDADQKAKLERKLDEYRKRIAAKGPVVDADLACKEFVLSELLAQGSVTRDGVTDAVGHVPHVTSEHIDNALAVVSAYNIGEMCLVRGGSGLH